MVPERWLLLPLFRNRIEKKMAKPVLHSYFRSSASWRVRIALALKGVEYDYVPVDLMKDGGQHHQEAYHQLNPMDQVPTLVIDGNVLTDSLAIMEYLDETRPTPPLLPTDPVLKAKVRALSHVIASSTQPRQNLSVVLYVGELGLDMMAWARKYVVAGLTGFEKMVSSSAGKYCVGDEVTMADLCLIPQIYSAKIFEVDMSEYPTINKIVENCRQLEAFKKADAGAQPDTPADMKIEQ